MLFDKNIRVATNSKKGSTKMEDQKRIYKVEILEKKGTCDSELFELMAKNGDLTAQKLADMTGVQVKITGYAICHIITDDKDFSITYFDTEEYGLISSGSEVFLESVIAYFGKVDRVNLTEIKTKKGKTYKAVPVLTKKKQETTTNNEEIKINYDDLPF